MGLRLAVGPGLPAGLGLRVGLRLPAGLGLRTRICLRLRPVGLRRRLGLVLSRRRFLGSVCARMRRFPRSWRGGLNGMTRNSFALELRSFLPRGWPPSSSEVDATKLINDSSRRRLTLISCTDASELCLRSFVFFLVPGRARVSFWPSAKDRSHASSKAATIGWWRYSSACGMYTDGHNVVNHWDPPDYSGCLGQSHTLCWVTIKASSLNDARWVRE